MDGNDTMRFLIVSSLERVFGNRDLSESIKNSSRYYNEDKKKKKCGAQLIFCIEFSNDTNDPLSSRRHFKFHLVARRGRRLIFNSITSPVELHRRMRREREREEKEGNSCLRHAENKLRRVIFQKNEKKIYIYTASTFFILLTKTN